MGRFSPRERPASAAAAPEFLDDGRVDEGDQDSPWVNIPPGQEKETETPVVWLYQRLFAGPRLIGEIVSEWVGPLSTPRA